MKCGAGRYQQPLIYSRPHTPSFIAPYSTAPLMQARPRILHEAPASLSAGSAPVLSPAGRNSGGPPHPQPSENGVGGWGHAARSVTCPARRSSGRARTRRLHMSVSFNSRGTGAAPLKLMPAPLPPKSRGAFLLASLPGPSGAHNSAPRTPFLHRVRSRSLRPAPRSLHPHPGCLLRHVRKPALRSLRNR